MAIAFVNVGTFASGTGAITATVPASTQLGDLLILLVESANQAITTPTTTVGTWTEIGSQATQSVGTAAAAGGTRLGVYWKWWQTGQTSASIADTGDHTCAQMIAYRGVDRLNPFITSSGGAVAASTANVTLPAVTTTVPNAEILFCIGNDRDIASTANYTSLTNANLTSINERMDQTVISGAGGGVGFYEGTATLAGNIGTSTLAKSSAYSAATAYLTIALRPKRRLSAFS